MSGGLDRVLFPEVGLTRADLMRYYALVADGVVTACQGRPVTVVRYPRGVAAPGFFQKHELRGGCRQLIRIEDPVELLKWVGLGAIEFHVPLGPTAEERRGSVGHDWAVMDLDPNPPAGWACVVAAVRVVAALFDHVGLPMQLKTSGRRGVHVFVPILPTPPAETTLGMERLALVACTLWPGGLTVTRRVRDRGPRVYLDYLQNGARRTMAAVYGVRAIEPAPVSWPTTLRALSALDAQRVTVAAVLRRPQIPAWERGNAVDLGLALDRAGIPSAADLHRLIGVRTRRLVEQG